MVAVDAPACVAAIAANTEPATSGVGLDATVGSALATAAFAVACKSGVGANGPMAQPATATSEVATRDIVTAKNSLVTITFPHNPVERRIAGLCLRI